MTGEPTRSQMQALTQRSPLLPLALASGQAGKILQQDPSWGCSLPFHSNSPSGGRSQQRKMLPPPSLASPAGRYFDCIPGELGCRCGLLILGSSESVFPRAMEQAAEVCREGEIAPEECRGGGGFFWGQGRVHPGLAVPPWHSTSAGRGRCPCSVTFMQP